MSAAIEFRNVSFAVSRGRLLLDNISLIPKDRDSVLRELFHPTEGLRFSYCRMPIGANDFSLAAVDWYTRFITTGGKLMSGDPNGKEFRPHVDSPEGVAALQMLIDVLPRPKGFSFSDAITSSLGVDLPPLMDCASSSSCNFACMVTESCALVMTSSRAIIPC